MRFTQNDLEKLTVKELLEIAKELDVKGRHTLKKAFLINVCLIEEEKRCKEILVEEVKPEEIPMVEPEVDFETDLMNQLESNEIKEIWNGVEVQANTQIIKIKNDYIENAKVGTIIAFKINGSKVVSGMIDEIHKFDFVVKTKNGIRFNVRKKNVIWVKTGDRWPKGIYLALKGEGAVNECKGRN